MRFTHANGRVLLWSDLCRVSLGFRVLFRLHSGSLYMYMCGRIFVLTGPTRSRLTVLVLRALCEVTRGDVLREVT